MDPAQRFAAMTTEAKCTCDESWYFTYSIMLNEQDWTLQLLQNMATGNQALVHGEKGKWACESMGDISTNCPGELITSLKLLLEARCKSTAANFQLFT